MKNTKKQESGRSMVEMVGVLAIMGLITAAAFVLLSSGYQSQKRAQAADEIDVIVSNVRAMAAQAEEKGTKFAALPDNVDAGKALAAALLDSDGQTPFGGQYGVYKVDDGKKFAVKLIYIDKSECQAMASRSYKHGRGGCDNDDNGAITTITFSE